jgi:hypothetical protein
MGEGYPPGAPLYGLGGPAAPDGGNSLLPFSGFVFPNPVALKIACAPGIFCAYPAIACCASTPWLCANEP